ncbi:hypothetical protein BDZ94DRAFT_1237051 [Collybia nuda]|uniref:Uncharacterized protein n=1 Tax=Collybia nuda TaxID=64659 RepID=A0A9P5Y6T7_9AGAR|nr:hypothetical protein BDZ94DRAFT_1237051 [Collybia nuda]
MSSVDEVIPGWLLAHEGQRYILVMAQNSSFTLVYATVEEATLFAGSGIFTHSVLVEHQDLPLVERIRLTNELLLKPNLLSEWIMYILRWSFNMEGVRFNTAKEMVNGPTYDYVTRLRGVHRRDMIMELGSHRHTQAERILALLIGSGVGYCLAQAIYPTALIALVNSNRTLGEMYAMDLSIRFPSSVLGEDSGSSNVLEFAVPDIIDAPN